MVNRQKVKTSVLVCYLIAVFVTGCGDSFEAGPGYNYRRSAPADAGGSNTDPYLSEMRKMREMMEEQESMRQWDELGRKWEEMVERTRRDAERERMKTHLYIQGLRRRLRQQELQRRLNERLKELNR